MGDYLKKNSQETIVEKHIVKEKEVHEVSMEGLLDKFSDMLDSKLKNVGSSVRYQVNGETYIEDDFDASSTLEKMAENMTVSKSSKDANFENLGGVAKTKKNKSSTDSTIDLLSGLDD